MVNFPQQNVPSGRTLSSLFLSPLILEVAIISAELVNYYGVLSNTILIYFYWYEWYWLQLCHFPIWLMMVTITKDVQFVEGGCWQKPFENLGDVSMPASNQCFTDALKICSKLIIHSLTAGACGPLWSFSCCCCSARLSFWPVLLDSWLNWYIEELIPIQSGLFSSKNFCIFHRKYFSSFPTYHSYKAALLMDQQNFCEFKMKSHHSKRQ